MLLKHTHGDLKAFAERLFAYIEARGGVITFSDTLQRYRASAPGRKSVYISIVRTGRTNPSNSIWMYAKYSEALADIRGTRTGTSLYGGVISTEIVCRAARPSEVRRAEEFAAVALGLTDV